MWGRWALAVGMVGALVLTACGGGDSKKMESAGDAAVRQLGFVDKKQFQREWAELHPAQQAFVSEDTYAKCGNSALASVAISNIKVIETFDEPTDIPGTDSGKVPSTAVTLQYDISAGGKTQTTKSTFHEYNVDGKWRWAIENADAYKQGKCP